MKKRMPIGVEDFKEVREQYYLVDKTQFLQQLIDDHSKVTLLTRPRRFGKTLTMSMVEYFFSIDKRESSQNLFQGLYIEQANPSYMHYQGQYPVIFLSLKEIKNLTWSSMLDNWRVFCVNYIYSTSIFRPVTVSIKRCKMIIAGLLNVKPPSMNWLMPWHD